MTLQKFLASVTHEDLPREIEVYEIGARRLYVKTGPRYFAISEGDVTPEELVSIARDIAARQETAPVQSPAPQANSIQLQSFGAAAGS